jgi:uncharacterized protein (DUF1800 family)
MLAPKAMNLSEPPPMPAIPPPPEPLASVEAGSTALHAAACAAHRFGLGEARLSTVGSDPKAWLLAQIGPADAPWGQAQALADTASALDAVAQSRRLLLQRQRRAADSGAQPAAMEGPEMSPSQGPAAPPALDEMPERRLIERDLHSRLLTAVHTQRPFAERVHWFWCNHFTVSSLKGSARGLVGAFEREAVRPRIAGRFADLLYASTTHTAMLRYLDNHLSIGPDSAAAGRRQRLMQRRGPDAAGRSLAIGLNENLAREVLELHTLGAAAARAGAYTQADVRALAAVLTGWRGQARLQGQALSDEFEASWHQGGPKTVCGRSYPGGPQALRQVLDDLARRPETARFICSKLARHFVADEPPAALVQALQVRFTQSDGELGPVYQTLIEHPLAWAGPPAKLKTPEEFVVSAVRCLGLAAGMDRPAEAQRLLASVVALGQRPQAAPSPAGWSDALGEWMGPDAVWKRLEWALRMGERLGARLDSRAAAPLSLGPRLSPGTAQEIARASDGAQALALWLMSPEFQRR